MRLIEAAQEKKAQIEALAHRLRPTTTSDDGTQFAFDVNVANQEIRMWTEKGVGLAVTQVRPRKDLLVFGLHVNNDVAAATSTHAALAIDAFGNAWLLHDGTVHRDNLKPSSGDAVTIERRIFFKVARLDSLEFLGSILEFQRSRELSRTVPIGSRRLSGDGDGPGGGGERSGAVWTAKHAPIVRRLRTALLNAGWASFSADPWNPDLLYRNVASGEIVIEVKATNSTHDVITAVGQVLCYCADRVSIVRIIAIPNVKGIPKHLRDAIDNLNIHLLDVESEASVQAAAIFDVAMFRKPRRQASDDFR